MILKKLIIGFATVLISATASAHTRLKMSAGITPRSSNAGVKSGPCGPYARVANAPTLNAGSVVTVTWEETVNHPGRFEIYFSKAGMANFVLLKTVQDDQNGSGIHQFSTTVTLPNETCTDCTLQLIQVMTEVPSSPSLYYSCSDMVLVSGTAPSPTPSPETPLPPAQPEEPCH